MRDSSNILVYFLGIGGIGMSAIARYYLHLGAEVHGYDKTESDLCKELVKEGAIIHYDEDITKIPPNADIYIFTPAIPATHTELCWLKSQGVTLQKRSDILQSITKGKKCICVAGTHGKTSISSMIAHILQSSGLGCTAFLGGISNNFQTNFWSNSDNCFVIEADEYDRSFHKLEPSIAIITAMDADHLDIYGNIENLIEAFNIFAQKIITNGILIRKANLNGLKTFDHISEATYSISKSSEDSDYTFAVHNIRIEEGSYIFNVFFNNKLYGEFNLNIGGLHNIENALAAIAATFYLEIDLKNQQKAIASFTGVKRRFEYILRNNLPHRPCVFIDDYAHHPEEIKSLITSAKHLFPQLHCTIIFQPHLFTRTRDFAKEFASALNLADYVILLPIYPARELPIENISSNTIGNFLPKNKVIMLTKNESLEILKKNKIELLITAGAGDIETIIPTAKNILESLH